MTRFPKPLHALAICAAFLGGLREFAKLQHWRLRERLRPLR